MHTHSRGGGGTVMSELEVVLTEGLRVMEIKRENSIEHCILLVT